MRDEDWEFKKKDVFTQAVANNGFPFEIRRNTKIECGPYVAMTEEQMLEKLECSRKHCKEGRYSKADAVVSDLRGKYGL